MEKVKIGREKLYLSRGVFDQNDTTAIIVYDESGDLFLDLTTNIDGAELLLGEGEILVKTWSENEPYVKGFLECGYFEDTGRRVHVGIYVTAHIWKIVKDIPLDENE